MHSGLEILVHVSGPSRGQDDTRYRKEAKAFLDFAPVNEHVITSETLGSGSQSSGNALLLFPSTYDSTAVNKQPSLGPSQRIDAIRELFHSRIDCETPVRNLVRINALDTPAAHNLVSPALPWTTIKETPHLLIARTPAISRSRATSNAYTSPEKRRPFQRSQSDSWQTPPSVIPNSQPSQVSPGPQISSSPVLKRPFDSSYTSEDQASSPSTKRRRRHSPSPCQSFTAPSSSVQRSSQVSEPLAPSSSQQTPSARVNETPLPLEIWPRLKPKVGRATFTTHLTRALRQLSNEPNIQALDIECDLSRPVKTLERGHWEVNISTWSEANKEQLWKCLTDFVGRGKAGFNVWCRRMMIDKPKSNSSDKENQSPSQEEVVRVFCWGELIREVFLILYVGGVNEKKNRGAQAKWFDAGGNVVGTVRGRYLRG